MSLTDSKVLIVRHGHRRGRLKNYMTRELKRVQTTRPKLYSRLVLWETGNPLPALDGISCVLFWLGDPLKQAYPACYEEAQAIYEQAKARNIRVANPPSALSNSIKSVQAALWKEAGIPTPEVYRFENWNEFVHARDQLPAAAIFRSAVRHGQRNMRTCETREELNALTEDKLSWPLAVSPLIDTRGSYRAQGDSIWARLHHKKRVLVMGTVIRTKHVFFSSDPIVSTKTYTLANYSKCRPLNLFASKPDSVRESLRCDLEFWESTEPNAALFKKAAKVLGLDFVAFDYSVFADGSPVIWEANPYPSIPQRHDMILQDKRIARQRIRSYYDAIADFLQELVDQASD